MSENQPSYLYRLSLAGHHVFKVFTEHSSIEEFGVYLDELVEKNGINHRHEFISMLKRGKISEILIKISDIVAVERPEGNTKIVVSELIRKKRIEPKVGKKKIRSRTGQSVKKVGSSNNNGNIK